jgi:hypothetical protein
MPSPAARLAKPLPHPLHLSQPRSFIPRVTRGRLLMEAHAAIFGQIWPGTSPSGGRVHVGRRLQWHAAVVGRGGGRQSAPTRFLPSCSNLIASALQPTPWPCPRTYFPRGLRLSEMY